MDFQISTGHCSTMKCLTLLIALLFLVEGHRAQLESSSIESTRKSGFFSLFSDLAKLLVEGEAVPVGPDDAKKMVGIINKVKNMLSDPKQNYLITWDESLALKASDSIAECPAVNPHRKREFFAKVDDFRRLANRVDLVDNFSLKPIPTRAIKRNGTVKIEMDIGSRIGCAFKNCSSKDYDLICRYNGRTSSISQQKDEECQTSAEFSNLCVEQPIDYSSMPYEDFRSKMMDWNTQRWQISNKRNITEMCSLEYSEKAEFVASTLASNCTSTDSTWFFGLNVYIHQRVLEPLDALLIASYQNNQTSELAPILSPERTKFGCHPTNTTCSYSYLCVIAGDRVSDADHFDFLKGKLCGHCGGDCIDELCTKEEPVEEPKKGEHPSVPVHVESKSSSWEPWKVWALGFCLIVCVVIAFLLVWTVVTTNYEN